MVHYKKIIKFYKIYNFKNITFNRQTRMSVVYLSQMS